MMLNASVRTRVRSNGIAVEALRNVVSSGMGTVGIRIGMRDGAHTPFQTMGFVGVWEHRVFRKL